MNTDTNLVDRVILLQSQLNTERRKKVFGVNHILAAIAFGWLGLPIIVGATFNSLLPTPVRNTIIAANAMYSDLALGIKCSSRGK